MTECCRVDEERWDEVGAAGIDNVRVFRELSLPSVGDVVLTELASLAREGGGKTTAVVLELVGVVCICCDVVAEGASSVGGIARENTTQGESAQVS